MHPLLAALESYRDAELAEVFDMTFHLPSEETPHPHRGSYHSMGKSALNKDLKKSLVENVLIKRGLDQQEAIVEERVRVVHVVNRCHCLHGL
ncbi:hypothetical protein BGX33_008013 [Mortierella sp. NVP41]|nr:hypothetical protein BGX33_008013 [Mortierella sp. NVP41]